MCCVAQRAEARQNHSCPVRTEIPHGIVIECQAGPLQAVGLCLRPIDSAVAAQVSNLCRDGEAAIAVTFACRSAGQSARS